MTKCQNTMINNKIDLTLLELSDNMENEAEFIPLITQEEEIMFYFLV